MPPFVVSFLDRTFISKLLSRPKLIPPNIAVLRLNPNETSFAVKKPFSKLESTLLSVGFQTRLNFFPYQRCDRLTPGDICIGPICGNDNWIGIWCDAPHVKVSSKLRKL